MFGRVLNTPRCIQDSAKHLGWNVLQKKLATFTRWLFSQTTPSYMFDRTPNIYLDYLSYFWCISKRDTWEHLIYAKLIMVSILNLVFSPYSDSYRQYNIQANRSLIKILKNAQLFNLMFLIFLSFSPFQCPCK